MPRMNQAIHKTAELFRDTGFLCTDVYIDPSKWSTRRKNIFLNALRDGLTTCGYETGQIIRIMVESHGASMQTLHRWNKHVQVKNIKEEMLEELLAYTCAWIRMGGEQDDGQNQHFLKQVEDGTVEFIPVPVLKSIKEEGEFILKYLKSSESSEQEIRENLAKKIEDGEVIAIRINGGETYR